MAASKQSPMGACSKAGTLPKGSKFCVVETAGKEAAHYNLFEIRGLTKGKLLCIKIALENEAERGSILAPEILDEIRAVVPNF